MLPFLLIPVRAFGFLFWIQLTHSIQLNYSRWFSNAHKLLIVLCSFFSNAHGLHMVLRCQWFAHASQHRNCSWLTNAHDLWCRAFRVESAPIFRVESAHRWRLHNIQRCRLTRSPSPLPDPHDENHGKSLAQSPAMQVDKVAVSTSRSPRRKSQ